MIRGLYKTDVVTITPDQTLKEAAALMRDRNVGDVVVVESKTENGQPGAKIPVGILTDRDLVVSCIAEGKFDLDKMKVADVMNKSPLFVKEEVGLFETIRRMREAGVGRILIVDNDKKLLGILTAKSIFDLLNDELHELGMIARSKSRASLAVSGTLGEMTDRAKSSQLPH